MIYITGDTHGFIDIGKLEAFASNTCLSNEDYIIVLGDFGAIWDVNSFNKFMEYYDRFPFTTLFVDGNHENFDFLDSFHVDNWQGGKIHRISSKIIHLLRGEVFTLNGLKFLALGGAESDDRERRVTHLSWWPQETIQMTDIEHALHSVSSTGKLDYIISHTCPKKFLSKELLDTRPYKTDFTSEERLDILAEKVVFSKWFFGHWHADMDIAQKIRAVYNEIIRIE